MPCKLIRPALRLMGLGVVFWSGFAFGIGFDRFVMTKYNIDDSRFLYSGDLRFVNQF